MNLLFLLALGPSAADDVSAMRAPTQCDAVFIAPIEETCSVEGSWATSATARTGPKAKELALDRLVLAVQLEMKLRLDRAKPDAQDLLRPLLASCSSAILPHAKVYCSEDPQLSEKEYCYATFTDKSCWKGQGIEIQGKPGWKAKEEGRTEICEEVGAWMIERGTDEQKYDECLLSCLQTAQVACRQF